MLKPLQILIIFFLIFPMTAQAGLVPCNPLKAGPNDVTRACQFYELGVLLVSIYDWMLGLAGVVTLYYMMFGAFSILQGWLSGDPEGLFKQGMKKFKGALWGLFFIACAYMFVHIILLLVGSTRDIPGWMSVFI